MPNPFQYQGDDVLPLEDRVIVIHGLTVPVGVGGGTPFELHGQGGYVQMLPAIAGEIELISSDGNGANGNGNGGPNVIPTPTAAAAGLALVGLLGTRRCRS